MTVVDHGFALQSRHAPGPGTASLRWPTRNRYPTLLANSRRCSFSEETVQTTLQRIVDLATSVLEHGDGVSVTLFENGRPTTAASGDAFVVDLDRVQYRAGEGRCLCALQDGTPILVSSTADDERCPAYSCAAVSANVQSSLSLPLVAGDTAVGTLNVYSRTVDALKDENDQTTASMFAEHPAAAVGPPDADPACTPTG